MDDSNYGDGNRAFLQALMARGTLTIEQARPILAAIFNAEHSEDAPRIRADQIDEDEFYSYISTAAQAVSAFDYEIRSIVHQHSGQRIWALVNTQSDPQTQLATTYNAEELAFIKRLLDAVFDKYNTPRMEVVAITELQAVKLARPEPRRETIDAEPSTSTQTQTQTGVDRGLKHSEVEDVLATLVEGGWFEKSRSGFYSLSPRGLLELRPWLLETFNDPDVPAGEWQRIKFCEACREIVTIGIRCANLDCSMRLHDICEEAFWRTKRDQKCPRCSVEWTGQRFVGEKAVTRTEAYRRGRGRNSSSQWQHSSGANAHEARHGEELENGAGENMDQE